jgi:hypothetical protein
MALRHIEEKEETPKSQGDIWREELDELQEFTWSRECERAEQIVSANRYIQAIRLLETAAILKDWSHSFLGLDGTEKDMNRIADELTARSRDLWWVGSPQGWKLSPLMKTDDQP